MKVIITNESGDWKEMLYTKDKVTYEVKNQEFIDFFVRLGESYIYEKNMEEMYECLYNLINYGYLYSDIGYDVFDYDDFDDFEDDDYNEYDYDYDSQEGFKMITSEIEYYVDGEKVTKEEYDDAWDTRIGYLGSSHWEDKGLLITNAETEEIIFSGKIS